MILRPLPCYCAACSNLLGIEHCDCTAVDCPRCNRCGEHCDCRRWTLWEKAAGPSDLREEQGYQRRRPGRHPGGSNGQGKRRARQKVEARRRRQTARFMQEYRAYLHRVLHPAAEEGK
jgi:hypothetical protein